MTAPSDPASVLALLRRCLAIIEASGPGPSRILRDLTATIRALEAQEAAPLRRAPVVTFTPSTGAIEVEAPPAATKAAPRPATDVSPQLATADALLHALTVVREARDVWRTAKNVAIKGGETGRNWQSMIKAADWIEAAIRRLITDPAAAATLESPGEGAEHSRVSDETAFDLTVTAEDQQRTAQLAEELGWGATQQPNPVTDVKNIQKVNTCSRRTGCVSPGLCYFPSCMYDYPLSLNEQTTTAPDQSSRAVPGWTILRALRVYQTENNSPYGRMRVALEAVWPTPAPAGSRDVEVENDQMRRELDAVSDGLGTVRFMDPPDGGDVSLGGQVVRMRAALSKAETENRVLREALTVINDGGYNSDRPLSRLGMQEVATNALRAALASGADDEGGRDAG